MDKNQKEKDTSSKFGIHYKNRTEHAHDRKKGMREMKVLPEEMKQTDDTAEAMETAQQAEESMTQDSPGQDTFVRKRRFQKSKKEKLPRGWKKAKSADNIPAVSGNTDSHNIEEHKQMEESSESQESRIKAEESAAAIQGLREETGESAAAIHGSREETGESVAEIQHLKGETDEPGEKTQEAKRDEFQDSVTFSWKSMIGSLVLVGLVVAFIFGFQYYLSTHKYTGEKPSQIANIESTEEAHKPGTEYLDLEKKYTGRYIMIQNLGDDDEIYATSVPGKGKDDENAMKLKNGQIFYAAGRGTYQGVHYYKLKDGRYVVSSKQYCEPLSSYTKVTGYLAITYVSNSGVKIRSFADFEADNIVKCVYVGEKVQVKASIVTQDGAKAFQTEDGNYIINDTKYYTDYTNVVESDDLKNSSSKSEKSSSGKKTEHAESSTKDSKLEEAQSSEQVPESTTGESYSMDFSE